MALRDAKDAYNVLAKYYGLRARDAFLEGVDRMDATCSVCGSPAQPTPKGKFYSELFGDGREFRDDQDIAGILTNEGYAGITKDVCYTPPDTAGILPDVVLNKLTVGTYKEQGWGEPSGGEDSHYSVLGDIKPKVAEGSRPNISVYQIFPAAMGADIADAEIITLFLNSLTSLEMSRAVPYIDVTTTAAVGGRIDPAAGNFTSDVSFSLGKFLGAKPTEKALRGKFGDVVTQGGVKHAAVSSMEIFTTPQTLVDAKNVRYSEDTLRRIDAFRPFMNLESLDISVIGSGQGTWASKTAKLNLRLFDRGRLRDIAPLVSPQRKGNVKFDITYGWSHPDGSTFGRMSDSQKLRMGDLIDAMKVTESYFITNSSFNFQDDGSVSITADLAMSGADSASSVQVSSLSADDSSLKSLIEMLDGVKKYLRDSADMLPNDIDLSQILASPDDAMSLSKEDKKKIKKVANQIGSGAGGNLSTLKEGLMGLIGEDNKPGKKLTDFREGRKKQITKIIADLRTTPDPFLRAGNSNFGVGKDKMKKGNRGREESLEGKKQEYVSYGKLMTYILSPAFTKKGTDLQFVFTAFNHNAAGVFDFNIAQFPIQIDFLHNRLQKRVEKEATLTALEFVQFVDSDILGFNGSEAYGLSKLYVPNRTDGKKGIHAKHTKALRDSIKGKNSRQNVNNLKTENLKSIYAAKRENPTWTPPQVTMSITTRPNRSKENGRAASITRVTFSDAACGKVMTLMESFSSAMSVGHFVKENYSGDANSRSAQRGATAEASYQELTTRGIVKPLADYLAEPQDPERETNTIEALITKIQNGATAANKEWGRNKTAALKEKFEKTLVLDFNKAKGQIRNIFLEFAPSLIYGGGSSGIITANLSSQQNDALTAIAITKHVNKAGDDGSSPQDVAMPLVTHPTSLKITTFGCPYFKLAQKFFIDMGTNTTVDNFYSVTGASHSFKPGQFTTSVDLIQSDSYGRFVNFESEIEKVILSAEIVSLAARR